MDTGEILPFFLNFLLWFHLGGRWQAMVVDTCAATKQKEYFWTVRGDEV